MVKKNSCKSHKRVLIRVDGGSNVGLGHIIRCAALAAEFKTLGWEVKLLTNVDPSIVSSLTGLSHESIIALIDTGEAIFARPTLRAASQYKDWLYCSKFIDQYTLVIVDHYGLDERWEQRVKAQCKMLAVIDDLANRKHSCHALIDSGPYRLERDYEKLVSQDTMCLLGPRFYIVNLKLKPIPTSFTPRHNRILISFGATDSFGLSPLVARNLAKQMPDFEISILTTRLGTTNGQLEAVKNQYRNVDVLIEPPNMRQVYSSHGYCIGASGSSVLERKLFKIKQIITVVAKNQTQNYDFFSKSSSILGIATPQDFQLQTTFEVIERWIRGKAKYSEDLRIDAQGAKRIAEHLCDLYDHTTSRG